MCTLHCVKASAAKASEMVSADWQNCLALSRMDSFGGALASGEDRETAADFDSKTGLPLDGGVVGPDGRTAVFCGGAER